jgi:hypothetical protein
MWPALLGETGILGTISIMVFFTLVFIMIKKLHKGKEMTLILYGIITYALIESVADTIFMSPRGVTIFVVFAFFIWSSEKDGYGVNVIRSV